MPVPILHQQHVHVRQQLANGFDDVVQVLPVAHYVLQLQLCKLCLCGVVFFLGRAAGFGL